MDLYLFLLGDDIENITKTLQNTNLSTFVMGSDVEKYEIPDAVDKTEIAVLANVIFKNSKTLTFNNLLTQARKHFKEKNKNILAIFENSSTVIENISEYPMIKLDTEIEFIDNNPRIYKKINTLADLLQSNKWEEALIFLWEQYQNTDDIKYINELMRLLRNKGQNNYIRYIMASILDKLNPNLGFKEELAICSYYCGQHSTGMKVCDEIIHNPQTPNHLRENTFNNQFFYLKKLENYELIKYEVDRKSTRLNSSHSRASRMPSSA